MHPSELSIEDFSYTLPENRIAKFPEKDRDASKLLIYKEGGIAEDIYRNIAAHIPPGSLMLFNGKLIVDRARGCSMKLMAAFDPLRTPALALIVCHI